MLCEDRAAPPKRPLPRGRDPAGPAPPNGERPRPGLLKRGPPPVSRLGSPSQGRGDADTAASDPEDPGQPGSRRCPVSVCRAEGGDCGAPRAGLCTSTDRTRTQGGHAAPGLARSPGPLRGHGGWAPCAPGPRWARPLLRQSHGRGARARACTHGLPAGGTASRQNKHPLPGFLLTAAPSGMTSFMNQTPRRDG